MNYFLTFFISFIFISFSSDAQNKVIKHNVSNGETIIQIAQKYYVTPYDIYQLNPDAISGLKPKSVLLIPVKSIKEALTVPEKVSAAGITHQVLPKETLYGIQKKYGVTDEALKQANPFLEKDGLQIGQVLTIPSNKIKKNVTESSEKTVYHIVLPKETKYSIAKQYGISLQELERKNPEVVASLPEGFKLLIKGNAIKTEVVSVKVESNKEIIQTTAPVKVAEGKSYKEYAVKPKETLYGLSKMFGISQEELVKLNPTLSEGVRDGMILKVPGVETVVAQEAKKEYTDFSKVKSNARKKLVLLLPFNIAKIEGDTLNSTSKRLKKDKFLNMTLDFYAGALVAIDSAKTLGLTIDVSIFDSQETKNTSAISSLLKENNLQNSDVVIGPFYQSNVDKTAELLVSNDVAVISPLSKDQSVSFPNVFQSVPSPDAVKNAMFEYMRSKGGNMIAVVDKKKGSIIQYIKENQKDVQFSALTANGGVSADNLKSLFVKDKMNYVVMETGNTGMIKTTVAAMLSAMSAYKVQLVILEPNETLDTDEISIANLAKLNLMYPSVNRENESSEALIFEKEFKKKNRIDPSVFATRGFDITFDTMMRLTQDKKYQDTIENTATEQVDNKFEYYKKEGGGYANKGIYFLYYDTDLTIKEAK